MRIPRAAAPFLLLALGLPAIAAVAEATPASARPASIVVDEWDEADGRIVPADLVTDLPSGTSTTRGGGPRPVEAEAKMRRVLSALGATVAVDAARATS